MLWLMAISNIYLWNKSFTGVYLMLDVWLDIISWRLRQCRRITVSIICWHYLFHPWLVFYLSFFPVSTRFVNYIHTSRAAGWTEVISVDPVALGDTVHSSCSHTAGERGDASFTYYPFADEAGFSFPSQRQSAYFVSMENVKVLFPSCS